MGLKSSPYHLLMFMRKAYSLEVFQRLKASLSQQEQNLLPDSFDKILKYYFDDCFIFADTYEQLHVATKIFLMASTEAKIKFSAEKTKFFTT